MSNPLFSKRPAAKISASDKTQKPWLEDWIQDYKTFFYENNIAEEAFLDIFGIELLDVDPDVQSKAEEEWHAVNPDDKLRPKETKTLIKSKALSYRKSIQPERMAKSLIGDKYTANADWEEDFRKRLASIFTKQEIKELNWKPWSAQNEFVWQSVFENWLKTNLTSIEFKMACYQIYRIGTWDWPVEFEANSERRRFVGLPDLEKQ